MSARSATAVAPLSGNITSAFASAGPAASLAFPQLATGPGVTLIDHGLGGHDYGTAVVSDGQGHLYVQGYVQSSNGYDDFLTAKFDALGDEVWRRTYAGSLLLNDRAYDIALDPAGNVIVAGNSAQVGSATDITVLKYDPAGNLLWSFLYDGPGHGHDETAGGALQVDSAGNALVGGLSWGGSTTGFDAVLVKVSPNGSLVWERRFNGPAGGFDEFYGVTLDAQDNVYAAGDTESLSFDFLIQKYDPAGNLLWEEPYDSPAGFDEFVYAISLDPANNVVATGLSNSTATHADFLTLAYDNNGNLLWEQTLDGGWGHADTPFWLAAGPNGEVAVIGVSQDGSFGAAGLLVVYDALGNLQWQERVGTGLSWLTDVTFSNAGNLLVAGRLDGWDVTSTDAMLRRYSPNGVLLTETLYDNACHAADFLLDIHVDPVGDVFGVGYSLGPARDVDIAVHRFQ